MKVGNLVKLNMPWLPDHGRLGIVAGKRSSLVFHVVWASDGDAIAEGVLEEYLEVISENR